MNRILEGACIFGQSGGPTSVINASAYGVIHTALDNPAITKVFGAAYGILGVLNDTLYDMGKEDKDELGLLLQTPSSALGSCRYKLNDYNIDDTDYKRILAIFHKYNVRYFFYNGGNDSMDTCHKLSNYMTQIGYPCRFIGIPKTIDNDLWGTDHCPGYPSAAKFIATSCMEIYLDAHVYDTGMICVIETMGRHAGWLAASASIASHYGMGPDLIYVPERDFCIESFVNDVQEVYNISGKCIVVVSEGIRDENGKLITEYQSGGNLSMDSFGHKQLGGLSSLLAGILKERIGAKVRSIEFSLLQRSAAHCVSKVDVEEAFLAGKSALEYAVSGSTDKMIAFERIEDENGEYKSRIRLIDLADVANTEKKLPSQWINREGNNITSEFIDYVLPLIQGSPQMKYENGLPRFARLNKTIVDH